MAKSSPQGATIVGINHVAIEVGDIDEALEWYGTLFAFTLRSRSDTKAFLDMGDQFIALAETDTADETIDEDRHLGLVVDDRASVEDRLGAVDAAKLSVPGFEIRDPWGNRLQIVEYGEIQFTKADHVLDGIGLSHLEKSDAAIEELAAKGMTPQ